MAGFYFFALFTFSNLSMVSLRSSCLFHIWLNRIYLSLLPIPELRLTSFRDSLPPGKSLACPPDHRYLWGLQDPRPHGAANRALRSRREQRDATP